MLLENKHFYHKIIRKYVIAFGNLFNNITVVRYDKNENEKDRMIVPISYAPKEKYINRVGQEPDFNRSVQTILPRMSFEIMDFRYDPNRKFITTLKNTFINSTGVVSSQYSPVPYDIDFNLYILVRNIDDGNQIVEQILPHFTPQYNMKLNLIPSVNLTKDIPIILNSVNQNIDYEGNYESTRNIIWTLSFTLKGYFFGQVNDNVSIIRKVIVDIFDESSKIFEEKIELNLGDGKGSFIENEFVYQGNNSNEATAFGQILNYSTTTGKIIVKNIQGVFQAQKNVIGVDSLASYNVNSFNYDPSRKVARVTVTPNPPYANSTDDYGYTAVIRETPDI